MQRASHAGTKGAERDRLTALLASSPLLKGLTRDQFREVAAAAYHRTAQPHGLFFRQGDLATLIYVLLTGEVKLMHVHPDGQEVIHRMIWPGEVFGGIAGLGRDRVPGVRRGDADERSVRLGRSRDDAPARTVPGRRAEHAAPDDHARPRAAGSRDGVDDGAGGAARGAGASPPGGTRRTPRRPGDPHRPAAVASTHRGVDGNDPVHCKPRPQPLGSARRGGGRPGARAHRATGPARRHRRGLAGKVWEGHR
jgi:cyclic nucleotide-binding protein